MVGNKFDYPPEPNEIEVSVFGPGYGEAILIHCGENQWIEIDSCIDVDTKQPATLQYFSQLGIEPASALKLIVASHWHDDHIRGLGEVFKSAPSALFACSAALHTDHFLTLAECYSKNYSLSASGIEEFNKILCVLKDNAKIGKQRTPKWALYNTVIWRTALALLDEKPEIQVTALSPSDISVTKAFQAITSLLPEEYIPKRRLFSQSPNYMAVVLWVTIGDNRILLGADLEERNNAKGWSVIVEAADRPPGKAMLFKIPHHGSQTAHEPTVWEQLLIPKVTAALTPYMRGKDFLPTKTDIIRICNECTPNAYISGAPISPRRRAYPKTVEKTLKGIVRDIRNACGELGCITFRKHFNDNDWSINLNGNAAPLAQYLSIN